MNLPLIKTTYNPYRDNVQGKANEPICVAGLLDRARQVLGTDVRAELGEVFDRLDANAPRIAIIGGSPDHPAHVMDLETTLRAATRIWELGGVPFNFSIPVVCDGTAQSTRGMSYSLQSRNAVAAMVVNQMEGQCYHGAFVIQGCDKTPMAIVCALAVLDRVRQARGEPGVFATFAPAHVLKGGSLPAGLRDELEDLAALAERQRHADIADDIHDALAYILQCSSNTAFQGVFTRAVEAGLLTPAAHKDFEKRLAVNTCDARGGICAFHGTGNSSRDVVAALGLVHPAVELLTDPPTQAQVNGSVDGLFGVFDKPTYSVNTLVRANIENAIRVHSATGGSSNLIMHLVAAMQYAGLDFTLHDYDAIRTAVPIPDIFDYSLTAGRDVFAWAQQCCTGQNRGIETVMYELDRQGVPMRLDAPTVTGQTWRERLSDPRGLAADTVKDNPIVLSQPRRAVSGIDVLRGNWLDTAVVKISGLPDALLDEFDEKVALVVYFENEDEANRQLLNAHFLDELAEATRRQTTNDPAGPDPGNRDGIRERRGAGGRRTFSSALLAHMHKFNGGEGEASDLRMMAAAKTLKLAMVISGQGPAAFGMPEMFTPMQHINHNRALRPLVTILSDGRYSGVTYGAAIGHITPEALRGGGILYLQTGDLLHLRLRRRRIDLVDPQVFAASGEAAPYTSDLATERPDLGAARKQRILARRRGVAPTNLMTDCTDASRGVVPLAVAEEATAAFTLSD